MTRLEDLKRGATVKGVLPDRLVTVVDVKWYGSAAVELTYKDPAGKPSVVLLYRDRERWLGPALIGLALLPLFVPEGILGPPLLPMDAPEAARLVPLNVACIGTLMGLLALQFRKVFSEIETSRDRAIMN